MEFGKPALLNMTAAQLRAFLAVAEYGGFGAAAHELAVSQPTISKAVKSLEKRVGPLFERSPGRAVILSPVGELLREDAPKAIQLFREIERKIEMRRTGRPVIRLGVGEYLYNRCKDAVSRLVSENGQLNIALEMLSSRMDGFRALQLGDLDMLMVSQFGTLERSPRIAATAAMKVYRSPAADGDEYLGMILPVMDPRETEEFVAVLLNMGIANAKDYIVVPNYYSIKSMCIAGRGQALLFEEDTRADVEEGRLVPAIPDAITVTRGCHYFGESEMLRTVASYLIASLMT